MGARSFAIMVVALWIGAFVAAVAYERWLL
jgi:hypothetical protein